MLLTLALTYIEIVDPGDYQRTISTLDIYSPKERFLLALQRGTHEVRHRDPAAQRRHH
jgi:hypothetical protein